MTYQIISLKGMNWKGGYELERIRLIGVRSGKLPIQILCQLIIKEANQNAHVTLFHDENAT